MNFTKNMGERDRTIRLIAGIVLIFWGIISHNGMAFLGILLLGTVYFRVCPVYALLGMSTRTSEAHSNEEGKTGG